MQNKFDVGIISGWTDVGGSTESFINLTNLLNDNGINTIFIGPHDWHLSKCKSAKLYPTIRDWEFKNIIYHFLSYPSMNNRVWGTAKHILSSHENGLSILGERYERPLLNGVFDHIHFVSEHQREYQLSMMPPNIDIPTSVIPNIVDPTLVRPTIKHNEKIGGVIGSIDVNKATRDSIISAIDDGCVKVKIFGKISDTRYFKEQIEPLIKLRPDMVSYEGVVSNKNLIYSSITDVYHNSKSETWGYIQAECETVGIPFHSKIGNILNIASTSDILKMWKGVLNDIQK